MLTAISLAMASFSMPFNLSLTFVTGFNETAISFTSSWDFGMTPEFFHNIKEKEKQVNSSVHYKSE
jgi:hypothetical protein